jgi:hypothetical protein
MKKSLLIAVAALFVALGANAQVKRTALPVKKMTESARFEKSSLISDSYVAPFAHKKNAKAPKAGAGTIDGDYILNAANFEGDFIECTQFSIASQTGTITLDMYDGEPSFEYNVVLNDFSYTGAVVYGEYNADEGYIYIPVQQIAYSSTYKEIYISGGYRSGAQNLRYGKRIILLVNEDGTMDIDEDIDPDDPDDDATSGWVSFLPNYVDPETGEEGGLWNYGFDIEVKLPNATLHYWTQSTNLGGSSNSGWSEVNMRVFVEDYGTEWVVSGFFGLTAVSVTVNGDGTCSIPYGQKMYDYDFGEPYGYYMLVGVSDAGDGQHITMNYDKTALNGFWQDGFAYFYKVEWKDAWTDDAGEHEAGYYEVQDDDDYFPYCSVASNLDSSNQLYRLGFAADLEIELDGFTPDGIKTLNVVPMNTNTKIYDLQGRAVDSNYKGVVIQNGKKFVVK